MIPVKYNELRLLSSTGYNTINMLMLFLHFYQYSGKYAE